MVTDPVLIEQCLVMLAFTNLEDEIKHFEETFNVELNTDQSADDMLEAISHIEEHKNHLLYNRLVVISAFELEISEFLTTGE